MTRTLAALAVVTIVAAQNASRDIALADLTVPAASLPSGCALAPEPVANAGADLIRTAPSIAPPTSSNPWRGNDRHILASIRAGMVGPVRLPDAPPPSAKESARMRLRLADGVEEGYVAVYRQMEWTSATVSAVRFADASAVPDPRGYRPGNNPRVVRMAAGNVRALVSGDGGACFRAIAEHVGSLVK